MTATTAQARAIVERNWRQSLQANARAVAVLWRRDLIRFWRERARVAGFLGQPLIYLVIFGSGFSASLGRGLTGQLADIDYTKFIFPGILAMTVLFTSVFGAISVVWDREFGVLREVLVAPISRASVAIGRAFGGSTVAAIQGAIVLVLAPIIGVRLGIVNVIALVALLWLGALAITSMSLALASRLNSMESFQVLMNFVVMPMFFLSGAFFPLQNLPDWMTVLTRFDPMAYIVDPVRRLVLGSEVAPGIDFFGHRMGTLEDVLVLLAFGSLMLFLAMRGFEKQD